MKKLIFALSCILATLLIVLAGNRLFYQNTISTTKDIADVKTVDTMQILYANQYEIKIEEPIETQEIQIEITIEEPYNDMRKYELNEKEVIMLSKLVWGEAMGLDKLEQSAVVWCVLNRVDSVSKHFPDTIKEVILQQNQFSGYHKWCPVRDDIKELVEDVLVRWYMEKDGIENVGRTLPKNYYYFRGFQKHNWFFTKEEYHRGKYERNYWDWSLENPYE